ncbi:hypothetical protein MES4922_210190 [Mesorhizobium ventifaucium]|uniref:Uncharacterized protein n=1 Tax=Mesorhizobium ventifaucium TaxID=666020 RepID=A0ABM9DRI3_9HYPH|nr:hypothetical protein MES4922_210190 [Mesorhizobium ventifaucium]
MREPFLSGPHQHGMDATKAVPTGRAPLTAILDPEKEMLKMTNISNVKRLSLAAAIVVSAFQCRTRPSPTGRIRAAAARFARTRVTAWCCSSTARVPTLTPPTRTAPSTSNAARPRKSARRTRSSSRADRPVVNENGGRPRRHFLVSTCRSRSRSRRFLLAAEEQARDEPDHNQTDSGRCRGMIAGCLLYHPAMPPDRRQSVTEALGEVRVIVRRSVTPVLVISAAALGNGFPQRRQFPGEGRDLFFKIDVGEGRK